MINDVAGTDRDGKLEWIEAGEEHFENRGAARQTGEAIAAGLVGEDDEVGAFYGDAGVIEVLAGGDVLDAAGNRAGGLRRRARGGIGGDGAEGRSEEKSEAGSGGGEQVGCEVHGRYATDDGREGIRSGA